MRKFQFNIVYCKGGLIMAKTRQITVFRSKWVEDRKNPGQLKKVQVPYVVRVNSAVTDSHRMCENF